MMAHARKSRRVSVVGVKRQSAELATAGLCHLLTHALLQTIYTGWNASLIARRIVNLFGGAPAA